MKDIRESRAFEEAFEIVRLPASRIIGREVRNGGKLGNTAPALWDKVYATEDQNTLSALPRTAGGDFFGWTCDYDPATDTFIYMVCALTPCGTPVPEGFAFRDIPEAFCAKGLYGETVEETLARAKAEGWVSAWDAPGCGWNAEMYFAEEEANPPRQTASPWHWLVPVMR